MINDDKLVKEIFSKEEVNILYELKISKNDTLKKAYECLSNYVERLGYTSLDCDIKKEHLKYINILKKMYEILPIY